MTLFKYLCPERIDVIEYGLIRFTQPDALNDPFELRPRFESLVAEAEVLANLEETPVDLEPMLEQAYAMLPAAYRSMLPFEVAAQHVNAFMKTEDGREAAAEGLKIFLTMMRDGAAPIRDTIYRIFNDNVGILSLSAIPDHTLMWAHYAERHTGLVLCFDEQHSFFNRKRTENDEFYFLRKVRYDDGPAGSLSSIDGDALLVTKGTQWEYEQEWRMLVPLRDATKSLTIDEDRIHLFEYPSDALTAVIVGAQANSDLELSLRDLIRRRSDLAHVQVFRATLDVHSRSIKVSQAK